MITFSYCSKILKLWFNFSNNTGIYIRQNNRYRCPFFYIECRNEKDVTLLTHVIFPIFTSFSYRTSKRLTISVLISIPFSIFFCIFWGYLAKYRNISVFGGLVSTVFVVFGDPSDLSETDNTDKI